MAFLFRNNVTEVSPHSAQPTFSPHSCYHIWRENFKPLFLPNKKSKMVFKTTKWKHSLFQTPVSQKHPSFSNRDDSIENKKKMSMRGPFRFSPKFTHGFSMPIRQIWLKKSPFALIHMGGKSPYKKYFSNFVTFLVEKKIKSLPSYESAWNPTHNNEEKNQFSPHGKNLEGNQKFWSKRYEIRKIFF